MSQNATYVQEQDNVLLSNGQEPATVGKALPDASDLARLHGDDVGTVDDSDETTELSSNDSVGACVIDKEHGVHAEERSSCCSSGSRRGVVLKSAGAAALALVGAWAVRKVLKTFMKNKSANDEAKIAAELSALCQQTLELREPSVPEHYILSSDDKDKNGFSTEYKFVVSARLNVCGYNGVKVSAPSVDILVQRGATCVGVVPWSTDVNWVRGYLNKAKVNLWSGYGDVGLGVCVSKGLCDFGISVDDGCSMLSSVIARGLFGYRPTSGLVIAEGCSDCSPTLNSLCIATNKASILSQCSKALNVPQGHAQDDVERYLVAEDLFAVCSDNVKQVLPSVISAVKRWAGPDQAQSLSLCSWMYHRIPSLKKFMGGLGGKVSAKGEDEIPSAEDILDALVSAACTIRSKEVKDSHIPWYDSSRLGSYSEAINVAEDLSVACRNAMEEGLVFVIPACSSIPPDSHASDKAIKKWENDCLRFSCLSALAGIPEVLIPICMNAKGTQNISIGVLARQRRDSTLLRLADKVCMYIKEEREKLKDTGKKKDGSSPKEQVILGEHEKNQGNKCFLEKKYDQAIQHYSTAIQLDPKNPIYFSNRAMAYLKLGAYQQAEHDCSRALELDPCLVKALLRRGAARVALAEFVEAKADFERVLVLEPQNKQARVELKNTASLLM